MIPKIIHYCWFGKSHKSHLIEKCIQSWKIYLPDYEIREWNEDSFDLNCNVFVREAAIESKWAFVSDFVRAYALFEYGGVYLDTDVEIRQSLDRFLHHGAFSGFESIGFPFTALWGAKKGHSWPKNVIDHYSFLTSFQKVTNTNKVSDILINVYGVDPLKNQYQELTDDVHIYPSNYFCLDIDINFAVHHFEGSWLTIDSNTYSDKLLKNYHVMKYLNYHENEQSLISDLYTRNELTMSGLFRFILKRIKKRASLWVQ